ncbi:MAG: glutathione peroxidase [Paracoccaceae bacterium]|nr:glutathione peroxidase [Pseudomonadota bacterium]MDA0852646.1 glutathione peroxidase [Pseudomonadota bacterium]MDA1295228.1 glutathione peroxidase [Pseudomonadota bacterium]
MLTTLPALAADFVFEDIDGGQISLGDLRGKAVLVVNTASRCGFTSQYAGLQKLYDTYKDEGLEILAVPSGDFRQELKSEDMVKQFCEINYGLTIPMTTITHVKGPEAHPFYKWIQEEYDFVPSWNFNKILLDQEGKMVASFGSTARPSGWRITRKINALLR